MVNAELKFIFLKTPQIRHRFVSQIKNSNLFPVVRDETYYANLVGEKYEFFGRSYSGFVNVDDFNKAIREGYVSLVIKE